MAALVDCQSASVLIDQQQPKKKTTAAAALAVHDTTQRPLLSCSVDSARQLSLSTNPNYPTTLPSIPTWPPSVVVGWRDPTGRRESGVQPLRPHSFPPTGSLSPPPHPPVRRLLEQLLAPISRRLLSALSALFASFCIFFPPVHFCSC